MLRGSDLVMLCFSKNTELPKLLVQVLHICGNTRLDDTEIMIIHLLSLRRLCTEKGASRINEIFSLVVHFPVNKEIFLFGTYAACNTLDRIVSKKFQDTECLYVECFHRTKQRRFFIECFSSVGAERSRNTKCLALNKRV